MEIYSPRPREASEGWGRAKEKQLLLSEIIRSSPRLCNWGKFFWTKYNRYFFQLALPEISLIAEDVQMIWKRTHGDSKWTILCFSLQYWHWLLSGPLFWASYGPHASRQMATVLFEPRYFWAESGRMCPWFWKVPVQPPVERCCGLVRVAGTTGADSAAAAILLHAAAAPVQWPAEQERGCTRRRRRRSRRSRRRRRRRVVLDW